MNKTKKIAFTAIMAALYVCLSMTVKIPVVGHIALDLGYIVLAVACYFGGPVTGAFTGMIGCIIVSMIASGWFPIGWAIGNTLIGSICGWAYMSSREYDVPYIQKNCVCVSITIVAVFLGVGVAKTIIECLLYSIPLAIKAPKNMIAFVMDAAVMAGGYFIAKILNKRLT